MYAAAGGRTRVLGITGSVGTGKSTALTMLKRMGIPVFSADACVHGLLGPGGAAVDAVGKAFPGTKENGAISRARLGAQVFGDDVFGDDAFVDDGALDQLEAILHPLVRAAGIDFIRRQNLARAPLCALDIPLLFETGAEALCDAVVVLTVPPVVQEARVLARPGMTRERLAAVLARQMPDAEKAARADFVIGTGLDKRHTWRQLRAIVSKMKA